MEESRVATIEEREQSDRAVCAYIAVITQQARAVYSGFDNWPDDARAALIITAAVQCIMRPEALGLTEMDTGLAMYAAGMGLGTQTQNVSEEYISEVLKRLAAGFCEGRTQAFAAMMSMPTVGNA